MGNKRPIDAIGRAAAPVTLRGVVRALTNGEYVITGPTYTGQTACMGPSAVLDLGAAQLVLTSRTHEPWDLGVFESLGLDPRAARFVLVKSRMYCRPVFVPISGALVECDSPASPARTTACSPTSAASGLYPLEPMAQQDYRAQANGGPLSCPMAACGAASGRAPIAILGGRAMATVRLLSDEEVRAIPEAWAVFEDIRATRKSDFVNNFWRALANDPPQLRRVWEQLKQVMMADGELSPLVRELIYIAVSTANGCGYCIHSHTAAARARA